MEMYICVAFSQSPLSSLLVCLTCPVGHKNRACFTHTERMHVCGMLWRVSGKCRISFQKLVCLFVSVFLFVIRYLSCVIWEFCTWIHYILVSEGTGKPPNWTTPWEERKVYRGSHCQGSLSGWGQGWGAERRVKRWKSGGFCMTVGGCVSLNLIRNFQIDWEPDDLAWGSWLGRIKGDSWWFKGSHLASVYPIIILLFTWPKSLCLELCHQHCHCGGLFWT